MFDQNYFVEKCSLGHIHVHVHVQMNIYLYMYMYIHACIIISFLSTRWIIWPRFRQYELYAPSYVHVFSYWSRFFMGRSTYWVLLGCLSIDDWLLLLTLGEIYYWYTIYALGIWLGWTGELMHKLYMYFICIHIFTHTDTHTHTYCTCNCTYAHTYTQTYWLVNKDWFKCLLFRNPQTYLLW